MVLLIVVPARRGRRGGAHRALLHLADGRSRAAGVSGARSGAPQACGNGRSHDDGENDRPHGLAASARLARSTPASSSPRGSRSSTASISLMYWCTEWSRLAMPGSSGRHLKAGFALDGRADELPPNQRRPLRGSRVRSRHRGVPTFVCASREDFEKHLVVLLARWRSLPRARLPLHITRVARRVRPRIGPCRSLSLGCLDRQRWQPPVRQHSFIQAPADARPLPPAAPLARVSRASRSLALALLRTPRYAASRAAQPPRDPSPCGLAASSSPRAACYDGCHAPSLEP
jgi:hypothetical protein